MSEKKSATPGQRLREVRSHFGKTQTEFAGYIGSDQTYLSRMETGGEPIGDAMLYRMEKELNINRHWITSGEGFMIVQGSEAWVTEQVEARDFREKTQNPAAQQVVSGNLLVVTARDRGQFLKHGMDASLSRITFPFVSGNAVALEIVNTQMMPLFPPSSYIIARQLDSSDCLVKSEPYLLVMKDALCIGLFAGETDEEIRLEDMTGNTKLLKKNELQALYYIELKIVKP